MNIYLHRCILYSSFSKIAEKNNKVIGIILEDAKKDKISLKRPHNTLIIIWTFLKLIISNNKNKKAFKSFSKLKNTYNEIIKDNFQGCVQLFIISKESRGLGIGKTLMNYLYSYMKSMCVKSMYLYTDTHCNYGFYESQNSIRLNKKEVYFHSIKE